ncbi:MAG: hypothetical protein IT472_04165 [Thermomonas sp.]|nr:hypothetical protein [Thermomonas sp.]
MHRIGMGLLLSGALVPAACSQAPAPLAAAQPQPATAPTPAVAVANEPAAEPQPTGPAAEIAPDSPFAFTVSITLSPAAAQKLAASKETIVISAFHYGDPKPDAPKSAVDDMGQIHLGNQEIELRDAGDAVFDGHAVNTGYLRFVDGDPKVNINVYSGRHASEDNVLNCDFFDDAIQIAHAKPIAIHCGLIGE